MRSITLKIDDVLMKMIMLTPIAMLLQGRIDSVNKILVGGILVFLVFAILRDGNIRIKTFVNIFVAMVVFLYSLLGITKIYFTINMLFYFPLWTFYLSYAIDSHQKMIEAFKANEKFATKVIWLWIILIGISSVLPNSYTDGEFHSFANGNFRFAPTVFFMAAFIWAYAGAFKKKKYMLFMLVPFAAMIATGSRTYTIIFLVLVALAFYNYFEKKRYFVLLMIPCVLLVVNVLSGSAFIEKFIRSANNQYVSDPLAAITSNRSVFWVKELEMFFKASIREKLLGGGLTASYVKNVKISGQAIWAHNDFLEALNAHGLIGLIIYIKLFVDAFRKFKWEYRYTLIQGTVFVLCWVLNAFFNGLYVYTTAMLAIPFLAYAVTVDFSKIKIDKE